jgi:hypothetical protein
VFLRIMLVKSGNVRRSFVHHYKLSHPRLATFGLSSENQCWRQSSEWSGGTPKNLFAIARAITLANL